MDTNNYQELLAKYRQGTCSEAELRQLEAWYADWHSHDRIQLSEDDLNKAEALMRREVMSRTAVKKIISWRKLSVAASITLVLAAALYYRNRSIPDHRRHEVAKVQTERIGPGKQGATLTLANGKKIKLTSIPNGVLAQQAGISISKTADGSVSYEPQKQESKNSDGSNAINTLSTEKGEIFQLRLPDGSLAFLNAASSLTYAADLTKNGKRIVKLTGEAYFEVAKDKLHPFIVETKNQQVQVLGTHFNVNSYPDDAAQKTTLLEGSVKVTSGTKSEMIAPGEQALLTGTELTRATVDVSHALAWKNGLFNFESADIQSAMRQIARWYNVDVVYDGPVPKDKINGKVYRSADLSEALLILKYMDIHYTIKGRTITIRS